MQINPELYHHIIQEQGYLRMLQGNLLDAFDALNGSLQYPDIALDRIATVLRAIEIRLADNAK